MVSPFRSWSGWSISGAHMSSFLVWWQHQMKASCIVQSFTTAGQKHLKTRVAPWFTNSARCLHLSTFLRPILGIVSVLSNVFMLKMYCKLQMELNNVSLCCLPLSIAQSLPSGIGIQCLKTLSPGVASKLLVTQATATALLTILTCGLWLQDCWADCRPRNPTAPLRSVCNLPPQELQECQGLQVQLALLLFDCN